MYNIYSPAVSDTRSAFKSAECWSGISVFSLFYFLYFIFYILYFIATDFRGFKGFLLETGVSTGYRRDFDWICAGMCGTSAGRRREYRLDMRWSSA